MKLSLSILMSLFFTFSVYAQEYRLHEPSPQDYVDNVQQIIELADTAYIYRELFNIDLFAEVSLMEDEINWRYLDEDHLTYDQLATIYQAYETGDRPGSSDSTPPGKHWLKQLVNLWLKENSINLDEVSAFEMGNYRIVVQPLRTTLGTSNVRWGFLLRLQANSQQTTENFFIIPTDDGYVIPDLPRSIDSGLLYSGDMNGDGKPDIAYIHSDHIGNSYNSGGLIIASLQADNQFEQLTSLGYFQGGYEFPPSRYNWWFTNVGDGKTSVIQNQNLGSNWDCSFVETKLFIWDDNDQLVNHSIQEFYPDTFGCLVAQAEQEMWSHNYSEAVTFYERALDLDETSEDLMPHTAIRLGLAYLLTEQFVEAEAIYETLSTSESDYVQTILETYYRDPRALPICQTMYNYPFDGKEYLQSNGHFETYSGGFNRLNVGISYFSLENATCNLGHVLDAQLQTMSFVATESPFPQIQSLGLEVANAIEIDFTMDGKTEWLIWLDAPGLAPMLFSTNDDNYEVTRLVEYGSILRQSTEYNHYGVMTLPNRSEQVLVNIDYDIDLLSEINCASSCGGGGGYVYCGYGDLSSTPRRIGSITLWQMQEGSIGYSFMKPVCDLLDVNDIISSDDAPLEIHAGKYVFSAEDEFSSTVMPAVYSWDSKLEAYVLTPEPSPTPVSTLTPIPEIVDTPQERVYALSNYDFNQLRQTFNEEDYEAVVRIVDASLSNPDSKDYDIERFENPFRYYRALALEELNKKDEALVDYITIYESQPDSAWGILAQLHLVDLDR